MLHLVCLIFTQIERREKQQFVVFGLVLAVAIS